LLNLTELNVIRTALCCFESPSDSFYLSPEVDEGFEVSGFRDLGILEIGHHEVKSRVHQEVCALLEMPRISPPMLLNQGLPFSHSFSLCSRQVEDIPEFFFKEEDLFDRGSLIHLNHLRDEEIVFFAPSVHAFQKTPFHLPGFFSAKGPALSLERLSELDESIFEIVPDPLHDVEVVVLRRYVWPDFADQFREGRPEVKGDAVRVDAPILRLSKESFYCATAIKPKNQGTGSSYSS
jgi:hypothetical protein